MAEEFSQCILIKVVAQICQMVGFDKVMTTPLVVLADILKRFISKLGRIALQYGEHCGHSTISISDLSLAFWDCGISPEELTEFLNIVSPLPKTISVPKFPVMIKNTVLDCPNIDDFQTCSQQKGGNSKDSLKIKISLSKIKLACKVKKSKSKKRKKKKKNENKTG